MTSEPTGRDLDRAIAELMGETVELLPAMISPEDGEYSPITYTFWAEPDCEELFWRIERTPRAGTAFIGGVCVDGSRVPDFHLSLDALQAPEQVLRDAGWHLETNYEGSTTRLYWACWWNGKATNGGGMRWEAEAPTEAAARAAAVYAGLKAWKEASGVVE